ncbi:MAG: hypothetical protein H6632_18940 [Anaerolineales bacterium]|nr:hypothetical protein [Anaerolineales bacterium]
MATNQKYIDQVRVVLGKLQGFRNIRSEADAKSFIKAISDSQRELRNIKREVSQEMKRVRVEYASASRQITKNSTVLTMFTKGTWNKSVRIGATMQRQKLMEDRDNILAAYDELKFLIDQQIAELDGVKDSSQVAIAEEKERQKVGKTIEEVQKQAAKKPAIEGKVLRRLTSQKQSQSGIEGIDQESLAEGQFRQILRIALADGVITEEEMIEADKVRKELGITSARARKILEEMLPTII